MALYVVEAMPEAPDDGTGSVQEQFAVEYFSPATDSPTELFEKMYWASVTQGDGPLDGYSGYTPINHTTQVELMREWCTIADWEPAVFNGAIKLFEAAWQKRTGYKSGQTAKPIVH